MVNSHEEKVQTYLVVYQRNHPTGESFLRRSLFARSSLPFVSGGILSSPSEENICSIVKVKKMTGGERSKIIKVHFFFMLQRVLA